MNNLKFEVELEFSGDLQITDLPTDQLKPEQYALNSRIHTIIMMNVLDALVMQCRDTENGIAPDYLPILLEKIRVSHSSGETVSIDLNE